MWFYLSFKIHDFKCILCYVIIYEKHEKLLVQMVQILWTVEESGVT